MNTSVYDCDDNSLREDYALLLIENLNLKQKISNLAVAIECIEDEHQDFLCRDDLINIIESQAETISDLKKYVAKKIQDDSSADIVYKLTSKNALLTAALLNSIDVNAKLREQLIKVLNTVENKNIIL